MYVFRCKFGMSPHFGVKIGLFLGLSDTFQKLECIRGTDTAERFYCMPHADEIYKASLCGGPCKPWCHYLMLPDAWQVAKM